MLKKLVSAFLATAVMFLLCGCKSYTADTAELLSPPSLSGDLKNISEVIKLTAGDDYTLKYPSRGSYRSAVITKDINNDGTDECFAFYGISKGETVTMHINVIHKKNGEWQSAGEQHIVAGGVDKVDFYDLDGNGVLDILVGYEIYGASEKQLAVYSFTENTVTQRMLKKYTDFAVCNLDGDSKNEVLLIDFNATEQKNTASLYALNDEGVIQTGSSDLDGKVQSVGEPVVSQLSSGKPAVYIDSVKGLGAITEVIFFENGELLNTLYDSELQENSKTLRSAAFTTYDINGDGILEIPVQENVPAVANAEVTEKLYLTKWCSFNGESLTTQLTAMINTIDGYYYVIPQKWVGNIAVLKDTDNRIRQIYSYNNETLTVGDSLLYLQTFTKEEWENGKNKTSGLTEVMRDGQKVFVCEISASAKQEGLTLENVKSNFVIYEKE